MYDISTLALKETFVLHLKHPVTNEALLVGGDEDKPVTISLYGTASKQYRNALTGLQSRQLRRQTKKERGTPEQIREEQLNLLVACSAGSENLSYQGEAVNDEIAFRKLYSDPTLSWIKDQVDEALGDQSNFLTV